MDKEVLAGPAPSLAAEEKVDHLTRSMNIPLPTTAEPVPQKESGHKDGSQWMTIVNTWSIRQVHRTVPGTTTMQLLTKIAMQFQTSERNLCPNGKNHQMPQRLKELLNMPSKAKVTQCIPLLQLPFQVLLRLECQTQGRRWRFLMAVMGSGVLMLPSMTMCLGVRMKMEPLWKRPQNGPTLTIQESTLSQIPAHQKYPTSLLWKSSLPAMRVTHPSQKGRSTGLHIHPPTATPLVTMETLQNTYLLPRAALYPHRSALGPKLILPEDCMVLLFQLMFLRRNLTAAQLPLFYHPVELKFFPLTLVLGDIQAIQGHQRMESSSFLQWIIYQRTENGQKLVIHTDLRCMDNHGLEMLAVAT